MLTIPRTHVGIIIATRVPDKAKAEVLIPFSFPIVVEQRLREAEIELTVVRFSYACLMAVAQSFACPGSARFRRKLSRRRLPPKLWRDRKSTRLNSSHTVISYAVFCLKKK